MANFNIGTLECPVEECDEQLAVASEPETDWKHGVVNIHLSLPAESIEHLQQHVNETVAASTEATDANASDDKPADDDAKSDEPAAEESDADQADTSKKTHSKKK